MVDPISLEVFKNLFVSVAEEMGVALQRTAYSPNMKERLDFSCAIFDPDGDMIAQAAHIPVHLGAMPFSVAAAISHVGSLAQGDIVIVNDPYLGGRTCRTSPWWPRCTSGAKTTRNSLGSSPTGGITPTWGV